MTQRIIVVQRGTAIADLPQLLHEAGCESVDTDTIDTALTLARAQPPDLLLIEDGLIDAEVAAELRQARADPSLAAMRLVSLIGTVDAPASEHGDALVDGFVCTHLPPQRVLAQVAALMRRKQAADASRVQRHQLTRIFERASEAMLLVAPASGDILLANPAAADLFGVGAARLVGKRFRYVDAIARSEHEAVELEVERSGGAPNRYASMRTSLIDRPDGPAHLVTLHDVTAAREARSRLDEGEQRYRSLFEQNMDAVYSVRPDGSFTSANAAFEQLTGYSSEEIARLGCGQVVAPAWADATLAQFRRTMAGEAVRYHTVGIRKDGSHFDADIKNLPIVIDGRIAGVYGIIKDVTERNALIRAQRDGERRLATLFAQAATGLAITTLDGRFIEANPAYCQMLGYTLAELQATDLASVTHPDDQGRGADELARAVAGETRHFISEKRTLHQNGSTVWVRASVTVVCDNEDQPLHLVGIVEDITAHREAEQALQDSRALLTMASRVAQIGGWAVDVPTLDLRWSNQVSEIDEPSPYALSIEQALGHYVPEQRPVVREAFERCIEQGTPFDVEVQVEDEAGRRWVRVIGEAARDADGSIARVQGAFQDIDVRKQAELAVIDLNERLAGTLESIGDAFCTVDRDWRFTYVNHRAEAMIQRSRVDLIGRTLWEAFPALVGSRFQSEYERVMVEQVATTFEAYYPAPIDSWIEVNAHPTKDGLSLYVRDVGERRKADERMRLLEASIERLNDIVLITEADPIDPPGPRIVYANPAFERHTGHRSDAVIGRTPRMLQGPLTDRAALDRIRTALEHRVPVREELINYNEAGAAFWLELEITPVTDSSGRLTHFVAVQRDISERKQSELRLQQKLFRLALLQKITRAIGEHQDIQRLFGVLCDSVTRDLAASLCAVAIYDEATDELRIDHCSSDDPRRTEAAGLAAGTRLPVESNGLSRALAGHLVYEPSLDKRDFPLPRLMCAAGLNSLVIAPLAFESRIFGVLITAREAVDGFVSGDCEFLQQLAEHAALAAHEAQLFSALQQAYEDLKRSQAEAIDQERLRALAQMAGGVAHDINNAISPITLYVDSLIDTERGLSPRARDQLETIRLAIGDVAESVARMRSFARPDAVLRRVPTSLNVLVEQVLQLTETRWGTPLRDGSRIELARRLDPSLPEVPTAEGEVREALTNLVINALDAMPSGGVLTLRTHYKPAVADLPPAACIEVCDTGIGMDDWSRQRCLEPYFTTKGEGGTGLGLTMVSLTMRRHGGELEIDSQPGRGTRMRLSFPAQPMALPRPAGSPTAQPAQAALRLLLIDDDPMMLRSLADVLTDEGHRVHAAASGRLGIDAFAAAVERIEPFDAVITDLGMPEVDGRRVAEAIKATSPSTPVLMLTGWGRRMQDDGERPDHVDELLSKPPRIGAIREALGRCMAGRRRNVR